MKKLILATGILLLAVSGVTGRASAQTPTIDERDLMVLQQHGYTRGKPFTVCGTQMCATCPALEVGAQCVLHPPITRNPTAEPSQSSNYQAGLEECKAILQRPLMSQFSPLGQLGAALSGFGHQGRPNPILSEAEQRRQVEFENCMRLHGR